MQYSAEYQMILDAIDELVSAKPNDRSVIDRRYAVTITDLEKAGAWFFTFVEWPRLMKEYRSKKEEEG